MDEAEMGTSVASTKTVKEEKGADSAAGSVIKQFNLGQEQGIWDGSNQM